MAEKSDNRTPRDLVRLFLRRWRLFILGASLSATAAMLGSVYMPVKYTGTAVFERRSDPAAEQISRNMGDSAGFEPWKLTLQHELAGYRAVELAVEEMGMTQGMPHGPDGQLTLPGQMAKQQLILELMEQLNVKWEVRSERVDLLSVSFTDRDPILAERMPNTVVRNYISWVSEKIIETLDASREFRAKRLANCRGQLEELTAQRLKFETKHAGMLPDSAGSLQERIQRTSGDIDVLRRQQTMAELKLARLEALTGSDNTSTDHPREIIKGPNPELQRLQEQLRSYQEALDAALTLEHMTEQHPTVQTLRAKIAQLEERIKETPEEAVLQTIYGADPGSRDLAAQLAAAQSEVDMTKGELERLENRLAIYQNLMDNFGPVRQEYLQIVQKQDALQAEADLLQRSLTDVEMALAGEVAKRRTHLNTVLVAQKQFHPSFPTLKFVLVAAIGGGLVFGAGLVLLANSLDRSVSTAVGAEEHFAVPILGAIDEIVTPGQVAARRFKRWVVTPIASGIILLTIGISTLNVVLWLRYPEQYKDWKASPVGFVHGQITEWSKD